MKSINKLTKICQDSDIHYFDYAATTFMPQEVIDKWVEVNTKCGVSIGRGNSVLSRKADEYLEDADNSLLSFFGLQKKYVNIYAKNVTEAINIVALGIEKEIKPLDIILVGPYEHHSNYLPWKRLASKTGALFFEMPIDEDGAPDYNFIKKYINQIKIISVSSVCNSFGYRMDIEKICKIIDNDTFLFVDDSQLIAHSKINTNNKIAIHFIPSHKMYGPKSIASASVRKDVILKLEPTILGGGMVDNVSYQDTWLKNERKFYAGTFDISLICAWAQATRFLEKNNYLDDKNIKKYYKMIYDTLIDNGYKIVEIKNNCVNYIISFMHPTIHAHDIQEYLSSKNIIIRSGNLCSQNSLRKLEINAINRISLGIDVNDCDVNCLCSELRRISKL